MYSLAGYAGMISDRVRMDAYVEALGRAIRPGSVVVDLGAGPGVFAIRACQLGADKVYAIEPDISIVAAKAIASHNDCADRIEFIREMSTRVVLPRGADVIVSDLRGVLPLFQRHIPSIIDARERLLAPGGVMIPRRDSLWVCMVHAPELYDKHVLPWGDSPYSAGFEPMRHYLVNNWYRCHMDSDAMLAPAAPWATIEYDSVRRPDVAGTVAFDLGRSAIAHGLLVWFDGELGDGVGFSNAPGRPELIYGQAFFPLLSPLSMIGGDRVTLTLQADLVNDDYVWCWSTRVADPGGREKSALTQSTFFGSPLDPEQMRKRAEHHVPVLNADGAVDRLILTLMDRRLSLGAIARDVSNQFPQVCPTWHDALTRVSDLSDKYSV